MCSTGRIPLECLHRISKRHQHDGRGSRRASRVHPGFLLILANRPGDGRDLVVGPSGAARVGALSAESIVRGSPLPTPEYVLPARPQNPVPCSTGAQA